MKLVTVEGPADAMAALPAIEGMETETRGIPLGDDRWQVSGLATDAAIAAIEASGCEVTVLLGDDDLAAHEAEAEALAQQAVSEEEGDEPVG